MLGLFRREEVLGECAFSNPTTYRADPDIAGIGIISSFLISAYGTLALTILAYFLGWLPRDILNTVDRRFFYGRPKDDAALSETTELCILVVSDQQIITGIAILAAGFTKLNSSSGISIYHWQIVVYTAWMSSTVHLLTLSVLRQYLRQRKAIRAWRLIAMCVLAVLLLVAQVPLFNANWNAIIVGACFGPDSIQCSQPYASSAAARCLFRTLPSAHDIDIDTILAFTTLVLSYAWKGSQLYESSHKKYNKWLRFRNYRFLEKSIKSRMTRATSNKMIFHDRRFRIYLALYTIFVAFCDCCESLMSSMILLATQLIYGTIQIAQARDSVPESVLSDEDSWGFGQVTAMLLLVLPVMAMVESYTDVMRQKRGQREDPSVVQLSFRRGAIFPRPSVEAERLPWSDFATQAIPWLRHMQDYSAGSVSLQPLEPPTAQSATSRSNTGSDRYPSGRLLPEDKVPRDLDHCRYQTLQALWAIDGEGNSQDQSWSYHHGQLRDHFMADSGLYKFCILLFNFLLVSLGVLFLVFAAMYSPGSNWLYLLVDIGTAVLFVLMVCIWSLLPWDFTQSIETRVARYWTAVRHPVRLNKSTSPQ